MTRTLLATTVALLAAAAPQAFAQSEAAPAVVSAAPTTGGPTSVVLEAGQGVNIVSGERVTVTVDATGAVAITKIEKLGWNAVAPGAGGSASVASTAEPGTIVYSLQGPIFKVENSLPTAVNYSATAKLEIQGQELTQPVKTCTVIPGRAGFEMWSAGVKVSSMVVGVPVAQTGVPVCAS